MEIPTAAKSAVIKLGVLVWPLLLLGTASVACSSASPATGGTPTPVIPLTETAARGIEPAQPEGLEISSQGTVLHVSLPGLSETMAGLVRSLDGVAIVEKYLIVSPPSYPDPFIGVGPGSRFRAGDSVVSLVTGEGFPPGEERVVIPGVGVNSSSYTGRPMSDASMFHKFLTGQSFEVDGARLRVVGLFRGPGESREKAILLPLATAQDIFGLQGELTDIFVTVDSEEMLPAVEAEIRKLIGAK